VLRVILFSYLLTMSVPDEDYSRNATCSLNYGFIKSCFQKYSYANRHLVPLDSYNIYTYRYLFSICSIYLLMSGIYL